MTHPIDWHRFRDLKNSIKCESYEEDKDNIRRLWEYMRPAHKHFSIMYLYRILTVKDSKELLSYVEIPKFLELGLTLDHLPMFIIKMTPEQLYKEAYSVIGVKQPRNKE